MSDPRQIVFEARGLEKSYDEAGGRRVDVLKGVDLDLGRGEMVSIVGVSGTGKTTLLHILGTIDRPDSGQWLHEGRNVFALGAAELASYRNRAIGFVFQFHHLLPEFSALENVMMPGLIGGLPKDEAAEAAHNLLAQVGLAERTSHKVGELSGGEQQRVAIARAMVMKPALLLADEPTGNLDDKTGRRVFDLLREMSATSSLAVVMVTHNRELAHEMDRCLTLTGGRLEG